jgi:hypothetical protein
MDRSSSASHRGIEGEDDNMTEQAISARIDGDRIAIDVVVDDPDYRGTANTSYLDAEAAIRLGEGLARLGRAVLQREAAVVRVLLAAPKTMPLAVHRDPHADDGR